ncbi:cytochrome P450 [Biscogniauxia marginata]|nr:cytochrome P450 [Biscogniauxia marginata]
MPSTFTCVVGVVAATYLFLLALLRLTQEAKEPPSISNTIPFITPILKMVSKGLIYTLRMPGSRIYVINSAPLITSVQSQFRTLSFTTIEVNIAANVIGVTKATNDIIGRNVTSDGSYLMSFPKYVHSALSAGGVKTIKMFQWVRHELLLASTEGVYGPKNPFRDPAMEKAWYTFEPGIMMFVLKLFPPVFARDSFKAREYMIPLKETARIEIGGSQAILSNTLPGAFWMLYHIFSNPVIREDIRNELSQGVREDDDGVCTIDLSYVKSSCPILLSTFKEMMRVNSSGSATRIADHLLDNRYLLKKGSTIMMPTQVQHTDRSIRGDTVDEINHRRFMREPSVKRTNPVAFRGFGGGTTLCPERHFASTEILIFSALMVLRFDLYPVDGKWITPRTAKSPLVNALPVPDRDISVEMRPKGDKLWNVSFSGHDKGMEIAAEDIEGATPFLEHRDRHKMC